MKSFILLLCILYGQIAIAQLTNESEVGIASANGNARTESYTFKQQNEYKWTNNIATFKGRYLNASANGEETARFFSSGLRYENLVSSRFGFFLGETLEKDRFANIDQRLITDLGGRYRFIESDTTKLFSELGYRYMHEDRLDGTTAFSNYGRLYSEWENKWKKTFSTKYWFEYLPNISEPNDWQFNTEISLSAVLSDLFSLKTGVLLRYDHLPAPGIRYKTDTLFNTTLVAKF